MSKFGKLRKKFTAFVEQLSPDQVREQLILAYLQMEKCQQVLTGRDVEPVSMIDNGESSDLELFYRCKKTAEELAYLNEMASKPDKSIKFCVEFDCSEAINELKKFKEQLDKIGCAKRKHKQPKTYVLKVDLHKFYEPLKFDTSSDLDMLNLWKKFKEMAESMKARVLQVGTEVYFMYHGKIHKSVVTDFVGMEASTGMPICKVKGRDNAFPAGVLYATPEELAENIGKKVQNHYSFSKDHESAYFIDSTSRVFVGAKWYLGEKRITFYETIEDLRKNLLHEVNIIDDTRKKPEL